MKEKELKSKVVNFRTTPVIVEALEEQAAIRGKSVSQLIDWILREFLSSFYD